MKCLDLKFIDFRCYFIFKKSLNNVKDLDLTFFNLDFNYPNPNAQIIPSKCTIKIQYIFYYCSNVPATILTAIYLFGIYPRTLFCIIDSDSTTEHYLVFIQVSDPYFFFFFFYKIEILL